MNVSHGICGKVAAPDRYSIEGSSMEPRSGEYDGMELSTSWRWPFAAAAALCWKFVINMAAVSRSTIPSLLASICSSVAESTLIDGLDGPSVGDDFVPPLFRPSETRGTPPSFAWTVRSCRRSRSRRTKVLRHFAHLNGRSLVSAWKHC
jgi:hypothetical protein